MKRHHCSDTLQGCNHISSSREQQSLSKLKYIAGCLLFFPVSLQDLVQGAQPSINVVQVIKKPAGIKNAVVNEDRTGHTQRRQIDFLL